MQAVASGSILVLSLELSFFFWHIPIIFLLNDVVIHDLDLFFFGILMRFGYTFTMIIPSCWQAYKLCVFRYVKHGHRFSYVVHHVDICTFKDIE